MITSQYILYDTPPLIAETSDLFFDLLAAPLFLPSQPLTVATTAALYGPVPQSVSPLFVQSMSPVLNRVASVTRQGSAPFFLVFKMRFADSVVLLENATCNSDDGGKLQLYQVFDDGSESGVPQPNQPLLPGATITNPRLRVWAVPQPGLGDNSAVTCSLTYKGRHGEALQQEPPSVSVTFGLPPIPLYAEFSQSGSSISVYFDAPTNGISLQLQQSNSSCAVLLDSSSLTLLSAADGQQQPECLWVNASWLVISPAPDSTVTVGSAIVFPANQLQSNSLSELVSGTVVVRAPIKLIPPQVYLSGPSSAGMCGVSYYDAYASFGFRASAQLLSATYEPFWSVDTNAAAQSVITPARVPYQFPANIGAVTAIHLLIRQQPYVRSCIDELEVFGQDSALIQALDSELSAQQGQSASRSSDYFTIVNSELSHVNLAYGSTLVDSCNDPYTSPFDRTANATLAVGHTDLSQLVDGVYGTQAMWVACDQPQVWITVAFPSPMVVDHITLGNLTQCMPTNLMLFYDIASDSGFSARHAMQSRWDVHRRPEAVRAAQRQASAVIRSTSIAANSRQSATSYSWTAVQPICLDATARNASINVTLPVVVNGSYWLNAMLGFPTAAQLNKLAMKYKPKKTVSLVNASLAQVTVMNVLLQLPPVDGANTSYEVVASMSLAGNYSQQNNSVPQWDQICFSWRTADVVSNNYSLQSVTLAPNSTCQYIYPTQDELLNAAELWYVGWSGGLQYIDDQLTLSVTAYSDVFGELSSIDIALPYPGLLTPSNVHISANLQNVYVDQLQLHLWENVDLGYNTTINETMTATVDHYCQWVMFPYTNSNSSLLFPQPDPASYNCEAQLTTYLSYWTLPPNWSPISSSEPVCSPIDSYVTVVANYSSLYFSPPSAVGPSLSFIAVEPIANDTDVYIVLQLSCLATITSVDLQLSWAPSRITANCATWDEASGELILQQVALVPASDLMYATQHLALPGCVDTEYIIVDLGQPSSECELGSCFLWIGNVMGYMDYGANTCLPALGNGTIVTAPLCVDSSLINGAPSSTQYEQWVIQQPAISFTADRQAVALDHSVAQTAGEGVWQINVGTYNDSQALSDKGLLNFVQGPAGEAISINAVYVNFTANIGVYLGSPAYVTASSWATSFWMQADGSTEFAVSLGDILLLSGNFTSADNETGTAPILSGWTELVRLEQMQWTANLSAVPVIAFNPTLAPTGLWSHVTVAWVAQLANGLVPGLAVFVNGSLIDTILPTIDVQQDLNSILYYGMAQITVQFNCASPPCAYDEVDLFISIGQDTQFRASVIATFTHQQFGIAASPLQAQLQLYQRQPQLTLPNNLLTAGQHSVRVSLVLSSSTSTALFPRVVWRDAPLMKYPNIRPASRLLQSSVQSISSDQTVMVSAEVDSIDLVSCLLSTLLSASVINPANGSDTVVVTDMVNATVPTADVWQGWGQSTGPKLLAAPVYLTNSSYLVLPAGTLSAGSTYKFDFYLAWSNISTALQRLSGPAPAVASVSLSVTAPTITITAPSLSLLSVGSQAALSLDSVADVATLFMVDTDDINQATLNALLVPQWSCTRIDLAPGQDSACYSSTSDQLLVLPHTTSLLIPAGVLQTSSTYLFTLSIANNLQNASDVTEFNYAVFVSAALPATVTIAPLQSATVNPNNDLFVVASSTAPSGYSASELSWKWLLCDDHGPVDLQPSIYSATNVTEGVNFVLSSTLTIPALSLQFRRQYQAVAVLVVWSADIGWSPLSELDIAACLQLTGESLTLNQPTVDSEDGGLASTLGYASVELHSNAGPQSGSCTPTFTAPAGCVQVPSIPVLLSCSGWADDNLPLTYTVRAELAVLDSGNGSLSVRLASLLTVVSAMQLSLPVNAVQVLVDVLDAVGGVTTVAMMVDSSSACLQPSLSSSTALAAEVSWYLSSTIAVLTAHQDWLRLQTSVLLLPPILSSSLQLTAAQNDCSGAVQAVANFLLQTWNALLAAASGHVISEISQSNLVAGLQLLSSLSSQLFASSCAETSGPASLGSVAESISEVSLHLVALISTAEYELAISTVDSQTFSGALHSAAQLHSTLTTFVSTSDAFTAAALLLQSMHSMQSALLINSPKGAVRELALSVDEESSFSFAAAVRTPFLVRQSLATAQSDSRGLAVTMVPPSFVRLDNALYANSHVDCLVSRSALDSAFVELVGRSLFDVPQPQILLTDVYAVSASASSAGLLLMHPSFTPPSVTLALPVTTPVPPPSPDGLTQLLNIRTVACFAVTWDASIQLFVSANAQCQVTGVVADWVGLANNTDILSAQNPTAVECSCQLQSSLYLNGSTSAGRPVIGGPEVIGGVPFMHAVAGSFFLGAPPSRTGSSSSSSSSSGGAGGNSGAQTSVSSTTGGSSSTSASSGESTALSSSGSSSGGTGAGGGGHGHSLSSGAIAGVAVGSVVGALLLCGLIIALIIAIRKRRSHDSKPAIAAYPAPEAIELENEDAYVERHAAGLAQALPPALVPGGPPPVPDRPQWAVR